MVGNININTYIVTFRIPLLLYSICIFNNKKVKIAGVTISILIILVMSVMAFTNKIVYKTSILASDGDNDIVFNENYNVYLEDNKMGKVYIEYNEGVEIYIVNAEFTKAGKTNLVLVDENGNKTIFELNVGSNTFDINKK